jgi:hypothetical protein
MAPARICEGERRLIAAESSPRVAGMASAGNREILRDQS